MDAKILQEVIHTIEDLKTKIADKQVVTLPKADQYWDLPNLNVIWELVASIR